MIIHDYPIDWYVDKLNNKEPFSLGMFGDGEWQCIFNAYGDRFSANCEGTIYSQELTRQMNESLKFKSDNFYFAAPDTFQKVPEYFHYEGMVDKITDVEFVEKNMWNKAMYEAKLYPLIKALRDKNLCIISNSALRDLTFLDYDHYIGIDYPNCFPQLEETTQKILDYGREGVYLFACGIPASLFVQAVHGKIPNSWFIDLGSIWDGFVGIGGQRATRREFYLHPETWLEWVNENLKDIEWHRELPKRNWHGMGSLDINPNL